VCMCVCVGPKPADPPSTPSLSQRLIPWTALLVNHGFPLPSWFFLRSKLSQHTHPHQGPFSSWIIGILIFMPYLVLLFFIFLSSFSYFSKSFRSQNCVSLFQFFYMSLQTFRLFLYSSQSSSFPNPVL